MPTSQLLHNLSDPAAVRTAIATNIGHYVTLCCQNPALHPPEDQHFGDDIHWAFSTHPFGLFNSVWLAHVEGSRWIHTWQQSWRARRAASWPFAGSTA